MIPLITIAICCFREGDWLRECWESVLAQDDDRWEALLVLDGGANEQTKAIFDALQHPRLRKHACVQNLGHGGTRNLAFMLTQTPYHFYVDADDVLLPQSVRWMLEGFARCPEAAMVYGDIEIFGERKETNHHPQEITWGVLAALDAFQGGGAAYRMDVWKEMGGLSRELIRSGSDFDFNIGLAENGYQFFHVGRTVYRYRRYNNSNSLGHAFRCWEKHEIMVQRHPRFFAYTRRRRQFLTTAYAYSFRCLYEANQLYRARDVAHRALAKECAGKERTLMRLLTGLPLPVFQALVPVWRLRRGIRPLR